MINQKKCTNLVLFLIVLLTILECNSLYVYLVGARYITSAACLLLMIALIYFRKFTLNRNELLIVYLYIVAVTLLIIFGHFKTIVFVISVILPVLCFYILLKQINDYKKVLEYFANIMFLIAVIALFFYFAGTVFHIISPSGYISSRKIGWGGEHGVNYRSYYNLYFEGTLVTFFCYSGYRNTAIFVEGPMYSFLLSIAFYYEIILRTDGARKKYIIVFVISILTVFSTMGYLALILIVGVFIITKNNKKWNKLLFLLFAIAAVIIVGQIIADKFMNGVSSTSIRRDDILTCLKAFRSSPFVGVGYNLTYKLDQFRQVYRANAGLSTGLGGLFAYGGVLLGVWYVVPVVRGLFIVIKNRRFVPQFGFIILWTFLLAQTVVQFTIVNDLLLTICWFLIMHNNKIGN